MKPPRVLTKASKNISDISPPTIIVCPKDQFSRNASSGLGYGAMSRYFQGRDGEDSSLDLSWAANNLTYNETIHLLYPTNLDEVNITRTTNQNTKMSTNEKLILPYGMCKILDFDRTNFEQNNKLGFRFVVSAFTEVDVLVTDSARSLHYQVMTSSHLQDKVEDTLDPDQFGTKKSTYRISIKQYLNDPVVDDCTYYPSVNGFSQCALESQKKSLLKMLGCMPPWIAEENQCQNPVQLTSKTEYSAVTLAILYDYMFSFLNAFDIIVDGCKTPCTQTNYKVTYLTTRYIGDEIGLPRLRLEFMVLSEVMVFENTAAYGLFQFVIDVGSSLGLWLGLSALGIAEQILDWVFVFIIDKKRS